MFTYEEDYALQIVRQAAAEHGVGLVALDRHQRSARRHDRARPQLADSEHPAGALYHLCKAISARGSSSCSIWRRNLKDERTLRMLREAIEAAARCGNTIVLIDEHDEIPAVIAASSRTLELSLPDEHELLEMIKSTLRQLNDELRISVDINRRDLSAVIRNLRGLTRRQARQIIIDAVYDDRRFDAARHQLSSGAKAAGAVGQRIAGIRRIADGHEPDRRAFER